MSATDALTEPSAAVRRFADLSREDVAIAGGKGANLGELTRAGLPVPQGFVVGAPAYAAFCEGSGLRARLTEQLRHVDVDDTFALEAAAHGARELVAGTPMPAWLEEASSAPTASWRATTPIRPSRCGRRPPRRTRSPRRSPA